MPQNNNFHHSHFSSDAAVERNNDEYNHNNNAFRHISEDTMGRMTSIDLNDNERPQVAQAQIIHEVVDGETRARQQEEITVQNEKTSRLLILGLLANILSHLLFGLDPVLSRYLQIKSRLPALSVLINAHIVSIIIYIPRILYLIVKKLRSRRAAKYSEKLADEDLTTSTNDTTPPATTIIRGFGLRYLKNEILGHWLVIAFAIFVTLRIAGAFYATRFTSSTIAQLIMLLLPFMVIIIGSFLIKERITILSVVAMLVIISGGVLVVLGSFNRTSAGDDKYRFYWTIDFSVLAKNFSKYDVLGIVLAFLSTICLAVMNIIVKAGTLATSQEEQQSGSRIRQFFGKHMRLFGAEAFFLTQMIAVPVFLIIPSVCIEDWERWLHLKPMDWFIFSMISILVTLMASQLSFVGMQILGAANASSTLALRLVSAVIFGGFILGEWLNNVWQIIGSVVVLLSVTIFLLIQRRQAKQVAKSQTPATP